MINLFSTHTSNNKEELFQTLLQTKKVHIEKISSFGEVSKEWYEQSRDEWVALIEGEAQLLFDNNFSVKLSKGEHIFIPKMQKHKVTSSSKDALWLAVHFD